MSVKSFFSSQQAKQASYDRFFKARARSDFVQGRKLRALIREEAEDEAATQKLADMYLSATGGTRTYGELPPRRKISTDPVPQTEIKTSSTRPARERTASVETFLRHPDTTSFMDELIKDRQSDYKDATIGEDVRTKVNTYVNNAQRDARQGKFAGNRLTKPEANVVKEEIIREVRTRAESMKSTKSEPYDQSMADAEDDEYDDEMKRGIEEEEQQRAEHAKIRMGYYNLANTFPRTERGKPVYSQINLEKSIRALVRGNVAIRKGESYYEKYSPKPVSLVNLKKAQKPVQFDAYKTDLIQWLDGIFI